MNNKSKDSEINDLKKQLETKKMKLQVCSIT